MGIFSNGNGWRALSGAGSIASGIMLVEKQKKMQEEEAKRLKEAAEAKAAIEMEKLQYERGKDSLARKASAQDDFAAFMTWDSNNPTTPDNYQHKLRYRQMLEKNYPDVFKPGELVNSLKAEYGDVADMDLPMVNSQTGGQEDSAATPESTIPKQAGANSAFRAAIENTNAAQKKTDVSPLSKMLKSGTPIWKQYKYSSGSEFFKAEGRPLINDAYTSALIEAGGGDYMGMVRAMRDPEERMVLRTMIRGQLLREYPEAAEVIDSVDTFYDKLFKDLQSDEKAVVDKANARLDNLTKREDRQMKAAEFLQKQIEAAIPVPDVDPVTGGLLGGATQADYDRAINAQQEAKRLGNQMIQNDPSLSPLAVSIRAIDEYTGVGTKAWMETLPEDDDPDTAQNESMGTLKKLAKYLGDRNVQMVGGSKTDRTMTFAFPLVSPGGAQKLGIPDVSGKMVVVDEAGAQEMLDSFRKADAAMAGEKSTGDEELDKIISKASEKDEEKESLFDKAKGSVAGKTVGSIFSGLSAAGRGIETAGKTVASAGSSIADTASRVVGGEAAGDAAYAKVKSPKRETFGDFLLGTGDPGDPNEKMRGKPQLPSSYEDTKRYATSLFGIVD